MHKLALSLAILGLSAIPALAQTPTSFADVDSDADGELSYAELQLVWTGLTQQEFDAADQDTSGGLTAEELDILQPAALPTPAAQ